MLPRVYIDGHVGTTGLRIHEMLAARSDLDVLTLGDAARKDSVARRDALGRAELAVLCLPDEAVVEAAAWAEEAGTRVIDASTAHRVADDWIYGLPELQRGQRDAIRAARRVSNPGCWPTGFLLLVRPLVDAGLLGAEAALSFHGLSGYSGGGKSLIAKWEDPAGKLLSVPFAAPYSVERLHKHIPEMIHFSGLHREPQFVPAVGPFRCGMRIQIPLHVELLPAGTTGKTIWEILDSRYCDEHFMHLAPLADPLVVDERSFDPRACNDTNRIDLHVLPHPSGHILLVAVLDNLGKGASGVAVQNLNLMLGLDESTGLSR
jgi:N-acetyl-gamma-glutamyl-phosphate reductase